MSWRPVTTQILFKNKICLSVKYRPTPKVCIHLITTYLSQQSLLWFYSEISVPTHSNNFSKLWSRSNNIRSIWKCWREEEWYYSKELRWGQPHKRKSVVSIDGDDLFSTNRCAIQVIIIRMVSKKNRSTPQNLLTPESSISNSWLVGLGYSSLSQ